MLFSFVWINGGKRAHLLVVRCCLDLADGLHQRILDSNTDIATGVALAHLRQGSVVGLRQFAGCGADGQHEHLHSCVDIGETDVDSTLESTTNGGIQLPGNVCCAEDQNALGVLADTVHLNEQFRLDTTRCLRFTFSTRTAERVDFVNEDNRRLVFSGHVEELLHKSVEVGMLALGTSMWRYKTPNVSIPFTLTHPLRHQVTTTDTEESAVCLRRNSLGEIGLSRTRGPIQQDTLPRLTLPREEVWELDR